MKYFLFVFLILFSNAWAHKPPHVLVIHSYAPEDLWVKDINNAIIHEVERLNIQLSISTEYLDSKRNNDEEYFNSLEKVFDFKYKNRNVKYIITSDDNAFRFAIKNRKEIFKDAKIIFTGLNGYQSYKESWLKKEKDFTGIVESYDIVENIKLIKRLIPNLKKLYLINSLYTLSARYFKKEFLKAIDGTEFNIKFEWLEDYKINDLYKKAKTFEEDSAALYLAYGRDKNGYYAGFKRNVSILSKNSPRPIFTMLSFYLGHGSTGGIVTSGSTHGSMSVKILNKILNGEDINKIPVVEQSVNTPIFDYNFLEKFNINKRFLPVNSLIINTPPTFSEIYLANKVPVSIGLLLLIILLAITITLLVYLWERGNTKKRLLIVNAKLESRVAKRTEQILEHKTKMINNAKLAALGEMASGIAHEINNPLMIISLQASKISKLTDNLKIKESTEKIIETSRRISLIIKGLKELSIDGEILKTEVIEVSNFLESIIEISQMKFKSSNIDLIIENDIKPKFIDVTPVQLSQVLINLLNNSFDAVQVLDEKWIKIKIDENDKSCIISVIDSGKGISKEVSEKIMNPFYSTKPPQKGTGLGLSISKTIIQKFHGKLYLDKSSKNTKFSIILPKVNISDPKFNLATSYKNLRSDSTIQ